MATNDPVQKLYKTLLADNYALPEIEQFRKDMLDEEKAERLYLTMQGDNYDMPQIDIFKGDHGTPIEHNSVDFVHKTVYGELEEEQQAQYNAYREQYDEMKAKRQALDVDDGWSYNNYAEMMHGRTIEMNNKVQETQKMNASYLSTLLGDLAPKIQAEDQQTLANMAEDGVDPNRIKQEEAHMKSTFEERYMQARQDLVQNEMTHYAAAMQATIELDLEKNELDPVKIKKVSEGLKTKEWYDADVDERTEMMEAAWYDFITKEGANKEIDYATSLEMKEQFQFEVMQDLYTNNSPYVPSIAGMKNRLFDINESLEEELATPEMVNAAKAQSQRMQRSAVVPVPGREWEELGEYTDDDLRKYNDLIQAQEMIHDAMKTPENNEGYWKEMGKGLGSLEMHEYLPLVGTAFSVARYGRLAMIGKKMENNEPVTEEEALMMNTYASMVQTQSMMAQNRGYDVGQGIAHMLPYMGEFALTAGTFTATKSAVQKGFTKSIEKMMKKNIDDIGKKFAEKSLAAQIGAKTSTELLTKVPAYLIGSMAITAANPLQIANNTVQRMTPQVSLMLGEEGTDLVVKVDEKGESFEKAFLKGAGMTYAEFMSENLGGYLTKTNRYTFNKMAGRKGNDVLNRVAKNNEWFKRTVIGGYMKKYGYVTKEQALKAIQEKKLGWSGILEEYMEEFVNARMSDVITGDNEKAKTRVGALLPWNYNWDQELTTFLTTATFGVGMGVQRKARTTFDGNNVRIAYQKPGEDVKSVKVPKRLFSYAMEGARGKKGNLAEIENAVNEGTITQDQYVALGAIIGQEQQKEVARQNAAARKKKADEVKAAKEEKEAAAAKKGEKKEEKKEEKKPETKLGDQYSHMTLEEAENEKERLQFDISDTTKELSDVGRQEISDKINALNEHIKTKQAEEKKAKTEAELPADRFDDAPHMGETQLAERVEVADRAIKALDAMEAEGRTGLVTNKDDQFISAKSQGLFGMGRNTVESKEDYDRLRKEALALKAQAEQEIEGRKKRGKPEEGKFFYGSSQYTPEEFKKKFKDTPVKDLPQPDDMDIAAWRALDELGKEQAEAQSKAIKEKAAKRPKVSPEERRADHDKMVELKEKGSEAELTKLAEKYGYKVVKSKDGKSLKVVNEAGEDILKGRTTTTKKTDEKDAVQPPAKQKDKPKAKAKRKLSPIPKKLRISRGSLATLEARLKNARELDDPLAIKETQAAIKRLKANIARKEQQLEDQYQTELNRLKREGKPPSRKLKNIGQKYHDLTGKSLRLAAFKEVTPPPGPEASAAEINEWIAENSTSAEDIINAYESETEAIGLENTEDIFHDEVLGASFTEASFKEHSDASEITGTIARAYFKSKKNGGRAISDFLNNTAAGQNQTWTEMGYTPEDVIDMILRYPSKSKRVTTDLQVALARRYKLLFGTSIKAAIEARKLKKNIDTEVGAWLQSIEPGYFGNDLELYMENKDKVPKGREEVFDKYFEAMAERAGRLDEFREKAKSKAAAVPKGQPAIQAKFRGKVVYVSYNQGQKQWMIERGEGDVIDADNILEDILKERGFRTEQNKNLAPGLLAYQKRNVDPGIAMELQDRMKLMARKGFTVLTSNNAARNPAHVDQALLGAKGNDKFGEEVEVFQESGIDSPIPAGESFADQIVEKQAPENTPNLPGTQTSAESVETAIENKKLDADKSYDEILAEELKKLTDEAQNYCD